MMSQNRLSATDRAYLLFAEVPGVKVLLSPNELNDAASCCALEMSFVLVPHRADSHFANIAWFGGTAYGHTFPGVAATAGIGDITLCGRPIDTLGKLMGGFWSDISKTTTGAKRSALDQARMQLLQQLLAAELNASAFGSVPSSGSFAAWEAAYCGTNLNAIKTAQQQAASFNTNGDSGTFTPGTSAQSKYARSIADRPFWDVLP